MKQQIFAATDGSDMAMKAVDMAAEMAAAFDVKLTIGHVMQFGRSSAELARMAEAEHMVSHVRSQTGTSFDFLTGGTGDTLAATRPADDAVRVITTIGDEILRRASDRAKELGVKTVKTASSQGDAADAILDMANEAGADMIVVGHRGLGRVKTLFLGSVAHKVMQQAECTVVSVR